MVACEWGSQWTATGVEVALTQVPDTVIRQAEMSGLVIRLNNTLLRPSWLASLLPLLGPHAHECLTTEELRMVSQTTSKPPITLSEIAGKIPLAISVLAKARLRALSLDAVNMRYAWALALLHREQLELSELLQSNVRCSELKKREKCDTMI